MLDFQLCFWSFCRPSEALHSSALCPLSIPKLPKYGQTPSTFQTTPHKQHTHLPAHLRRDTCIRHTDRNYSSVAPWPKTAGRLLHPKPRWARSILLRRSFVRPYVVCMYLGGNVQADACAARVAGVGCGGWRGLPACCYSSRGGA